MNVVSMMRVMLCASDMRTIPIFTGPFQNLKYRGSVDAQKRAIYENFQGTMSGFPTG